MGSVERNHRVLNEYLLSFTEDYNWDEWIPYYVFSYNITPHTDHTYTPFELVYGKLPSLTNDVDLSKNEPIYNIDDYANELKFRLTQAQAKAKIMLDIAKTKRKYNYDKVVNPLNIQKGDLVLLKNENRRKLDAHYKGPYEVIELNDVNTKIKIGDKIKTVHNNNLKKILNRNNDIYK